MFGTLVISSDLEQDTLEYIENPDPVAAVSRNIRDKIHISCLFCRSRKVRCSGGRKKCQRCVAMGLDCVYPNAQGRHIKRPDNNKSRRAVIKKNSNASSPTCTDAPTSSGKYNENSIVDDLQDISFDDRCIDDVLFSPWMMDTPMDHNLDTASSSGSNCTDTPSSAFDLITSESPFSSRSLNGSISSPGQLPDPSMTDNAFTALLSPSTTNSAPDVESWEGSPTAHGDIDWGMNDSHKHDKTEPLAQESWSKPAGDSDSCCCLLSSISFLEKLVSKSSSCGNRIDLFLAEFRSALETLAVFIACQKCEGRVEQNKLLAMATRQISIICEKVAICCKTLHNSSCSDKKPTQSESQPVDIFVSKYRVNNRERMHLIKSLVGLQISEFQNHLSTIKSRYRNRLNQGQQPQALIEAEANIKSAQAALGSC